jgi:hypothetical protein
MMLSGDRAKGPTYLDCTGNLLATQGAAGCGARR